LGEALEFSGDKEAAMTEAKKAVELNPDSVPAHKLLARLLIDAGDKDAAQSELKIVLEKDPSDADARKLQEQATH